MRNKLTPEEKQALKEKLREEGLDDERGNHKELTLTDDKKEAMKKKIAQAGHDRLSKLDKMLHSRKGKKKAIS